jgi:hypothetical protein
LKVLYIKQILNKIVFYMISIDYLCFQNLGFQLRLFYPQL